MTHSWRYLTAGLYDMDAAPGRVAAGTEQRLLADPGPSRGPANARVVIVEFSDFECPFCRLLKQYEDLVLPPMRDVRVVFRFFPLTTIHPWARSAAEAAGCAELQGAPAFWALHDFLFSHQSSISPGTVAAVARRFLALRQGFDVGAYDRCMQWGMSAGMVERDQKLGHEMGITGTPALFINGRRYVGMRNADALRAAIAAAESGPAAKANVASR